MKNISKKFTNSIVRRAKGKSHWSKKQVARFNEVIAQGATIAYWCSDAQGRPSNGGGCLDNWYAHVGLIQEIEGPLKLCGDGALHATLEPHKWVGSRVWVVSMFGEIEFQENKLGSLSREFIGEILPEESMNESIGVRLGRKDLSGANLNRANLSVADLSGANLNRANLNRANLNRAYLNGADLNGADLNGADLNGAYCPNFDQDGWISNNQGYLEKKI
jgi:hypothetical protein